jgi:hypothetical protein
MSSRRAQETPPALASLQDSAPSSLSRPVTISGSNETHRPVAANALLQSPDPYANLTYIGGMAALCMALIKFMTSNSGACDDHFEGAKLDQHSGLCVC